MRSFGKVCLFLAVCCFNYLSALPQADEEAIHGVIYGYADAWNTRAGKGFGDGFADDADFVNIFGMYFSGREEIEKRHLSILQTFLKDSILEIQNVHLREVQPGWVVAIVRWKCSGFNHPHTTSEMREGVFTHVFQLKDGRWQIIASQNTMIPIP